MKDKNLIFLISQPRSGSTLTQRLLSAHSRIYSTAEPWVMLHPLYALRTHGIQTDYNARLANNALQDVLAQLPNGKGDYFAAIKKFGLHLYGQFLQERDENIFLDKTPRYYKIIPELIKTYPRAKFIFLVRNPVAVLVSIYKTWIGNNLKLLNHHRDDIFEAPEKILSGIKLAGKRGYMLKYEKLATSPEEEVQKLCAFLDIRFEEGMLDYSRATVGKGKMGDPRKVHKHSKVVTHYSDAWKTKIDNPTLAYLVNDFLKNISPKLFRDFGYSYLNILLDVQLQRHTMAEPDEQQQRILQEVLGTHKEGILISNNQVLNSLDDFEKKLSPKVGKNTEEKLLQWLQENIPDTLLAHRTIQGYLKALVKLYKGNITEAEKLLQQVLKKDASFFKAAVQLSFLYWSQQNKDDAVKYMRYARNIAPGNSQTLKSCLQMWDQMQMHEKAYDERCRYYASNPTDEDNIDQLINMLSTYFKPGNIELIKDKFNRVQFG